jgi:hypothetical protein
VRNVRRLFASGKRYLIFCRELLLGLVSALSGSGGAADESFPGPKSSRTRCSVRNGAGTGM